MRNVLFVIVAVLAVGAGVLGVTAANGGGKEKAEVSTMSKVNETNQSTETTKTETAPIPTERDVEYGNNPPWKWLGIDQMNNYIDQGKVVFLFSDAANLETFLIETLNAELSFDPKFENAPEPKEKKHDMVVSASEFLDGFIKEIGSRRDMPKYLEKMNTASQAMKNGNYDAAKTAIKEAKDIRETLHGN